MIVIGIDPHMKTHTAVALDAATGAAAGELTVNCDGTGHDRLLHWARSIGEERTFAIEDCRHVSGRLERHLLGRGERVVRVPPKMMAGARASARTYGKSDPIDAACVARVALREPDLPCATLAGPEHDVRLLVDHRDDHVLELAVEADCDAIVTHNVNDFEGCERFGIEAIRPGEMLRRIGERP